MTRLRLDALTKVFGDGKPAVDHLDLDVKSGEFVTVVGPSGCGKTTTLRMVAGLEQSTSGRVFFDDDDVTRYAPQRRRIGMVFQNYAIFPHMTVGANIGYGLKIAGVNKAERNKRVRDVAALVEIDEFLHRLPKQLSGGQRQRVALARAIVREPRIILFDEPLSNLDAKLRDQTRAELKSLHRRLGGTIVYVTHDQLEALTLSDRIAVMNNGSLEQFARPTDVFEWPSSLFVAGFVGAPPMNILKGRVLAAADARDEAKIEVMGSGRVQVPGAGHRLRAALTSHNPEVTVGIRPQRVRLTGDEDADLRGVVDVVELVGTEKIVHVRMEAGVVVAVVPSSTAVREGENVGLELPPEHLRFFHPDTGLCWKELDQVLSGRSASAV